MGAGPALVGGSLPGPQGGLGLLDGTAFPVRAGPGVNVFGLTGPSCQGIPVVVNGPVACGDGRHLAAGSGRVLRYERD